MQTVEREFHVKQQTEEGRSKRYAAQIAVAPSVARTVACPDRFSIRQQLVASIEVTLPGYAALLASGIPVPTIPASKSTRLTGLLRETTSNAGDSAEKAAKPAPCQE
ncbi:hypothetical protein [Arthrobacter sp. D3-16]